MKTPRLVVINVSTSSNQKLKSHIHVLCTQTTYVTKCRNRAFWCRKCRYACINLSIRLQRSIHMYAYIYICTCMRCMYICTYVCMCVSIVYVEFSMSLHLLLMCHESDTSTTSESQLPPWNIYFIENANCYHDF